MVPSGLSPRAGPRFDEIPRAGIVTLTGAVTVLAEDGAAAAEGALAEDGAAATPGGTSETGYVGASRTPWPTDRKAAQGEPEDQEAGHGTAAELRRVRSQYLPQTMHRRDRVASQAAFRLLRHDSIAMTRSASISPAPAKRGQSRLRGGLPPVPGEPTGYGVAEAPVKVAVVVLVVMLVAVIAVVNGVVRGPRRTLAPPATVDQESAGMCATVDRRSRLHSLSQPQPRIKPVSMLPGRPSHRASPRIPPAPF